MRIRGLASVASWLRLPSQSTSQLEQTLQRRLDEARAAVHTWKAKATDAETRRKAIEEQVQSSAEALRVYRGEVLTARRETPSIRVVRVMFAQRLKTFSARAAARAVDGLESQLLRVSAPYRTAVELGSSSPGDLARRVDLDGLTWWIPTRTADGVRAPYRAIVQTRDVSGGGVMLDLGANVGRMSIPRVVLGDVLRAYCAEPDPVTYACLVRNVIDNGLRGFVLPDQTAISDRNGTARLLRRGASESFRLIDETTSANVVEVPCCTLDTWVERLAIDLDAVTFVKIDVEGSERRVLAGAGAVLARPHIAWQMEIKPAGLRAAGDEPEALYGDLRRHFTHFVDLNRRAAGRRVRPTAELSEALQYIGADGKTDVLLFCAGGLD